MDAPARPSAGPALVPAHLLVLVLAALLSGLAARPGGEAWAAARAGEAVPAEGRGALVFGLAFSAVTGAGLVLAWLLEAGHALLCLVRRRPAGRVLGRLGLALAPPIAFLVGHRLASPWLFELFAPARDFLLAWAA
jgi:hypothetical protein